jgi:hypothetical protein
MSAELSSDYIESDWLTRLKRSNDDQPADAKMFFVRQKGFVNFHFLA